jgi:hypothetical protein
MDKDAVEIAATKSGLNQDEVVRAVRAYRAAMDSLHDEPEWQMGLTMSGPGYGLAQYLASGTSVAKQIESWKGRGDEWQSETLYTFQGEPYETFGDARAAELFHQLASGANVARLA